MEELVAEIGAAFLCADLSSTLRISGRVTERFSESLQQIDGNFHIVRVLPRHR
jgi:antirestriction protein ArdC